MGINIKNVIENLIYIFAIGLLLMANTYIVLESQEDVIVDAINKSSTEISNNFDKMRTKKDGVINLNVNSEIKSDTIPEEKKWYQFKK